MRKLIVAAVLVPFVGGSALAQEAPGYFAETYPSQALGPAMEWYGALQGEDSALDTKTFELIGLGVAAQIPCDYCIYAHTRAARAAGASEAEIREAVAAAGAVRHWSTVLNGMNYDLEAFRTEYDEMVPTN